MNKPWWEEPLCWLCDYGAFVEVLFLVLAAGFAYRLQPLPEPASSPPMETFPSAPPTATFVVSAPTKTPAATLTPAPKTPEYVLVFVPLNWGLSREEFEQAARRQADVFIRESEIENYFTVRVVVLDSGLENVSLGSDTLVEDVLEFAAQEYPGDRYIGLTDGDLNPDGESDVVGWTSSGLGMVAEYQDEYVVAHELGHTFGLCDEYIYADWRRQNENYPGGCPNPFPEICPQKASVRLCQGTPAKDGSHSIMGPAGMMGDYSFNEACLKRLRDIFKAESEQQ